MCKFPQGQIVDDAQNHAFLAAAHAVHISCLGPGFYWADFYLGIRRTLDGQRNFIASRQSSLNRDKLAMPEISIKGNIARQK